jgi:hypothetical protein
MKGVSLYRGCSVVKFQKSGNNWMILQVSRKKKKEVLQSIRYEPDLIGA